MGIGGGEDGVYVCFAVDAGGAEARLIGSPNASDGTFRVFMGQPNIRAKREAADRKTVLSVAKTYAELGELNSNYEWTKS
ncbi:hypothetical protein I6F37_39415 [Bradyrhizobium sp. NBAIM08]|nr:hypothetical protein [Bradyrhizobium sp. NBAIM08]